jgi:hypothetical protein
MSHSIANGALSALLAIGMVSSLGLAQERKVGDRIAYDIRMHGGSAGKHGGADRASKMTLVLDRVDADGSAHASTTLEMPNVPGVTSEATISPAGEILQKADPGPGLQPHPGMSQAEGMAMAANMMGQAMAANLGLFNTFAAACATQGNLRVGDSWHATSTNFPPVDLVYTVTGREQRLGHDAVAVSVKSSPDSPGVVSGEGYYDPSTHLVVSFHIEEESPNGGNMAVDVTLHP